MNKVIDITTRKAVEFVDTPDGLTQQQFLRHWMKAVKDGKFRNIAIIVMDENKFCDFGILNHDEADLSLFAHLLSDVKREMLSIIFNAEEPDDEDED